MRNNSQMKTNILTYILILFAVLQLQAQKKSAKLSTSKPNILFIMSDDHTTQAFGVYGSRLATLNPTPNIDKLANEGIIFDNVYCNNSICTPSRASILTGQYPQTNGVLDLHQPLDVAKQYLPKEMQALGYETAVIGKWHLKNEPGNFNYYEVLPLQGKYHNPTLISKNGKKTEKINFGKGNIRTVKTTKYTGHSSDIITDRSIEWLKNRRDKSKPFMLMHHFKAPHGMFEFADRYKDYLEDTYIPEPASLYQRGNNGSIATRGKDDSLIHDIGSSVGLRNTIRGVGRSLDIDTNIPDHKHKSYQEYLKRYLRCVKGVDDNVKRLIDELKAEGLYDNTIIIYTADQGFMLGEHDYIDKRWMYEESMRMPFIVHFPKGLEQGIRKDALINNTDFAPTLIDIAGGKAPSYMQGHSFKDLLNGAKETKKWQKSTYYRYWMHMGSRHANPAHFGIRTKDYKLIFFYGKFWKPKDQIKQDGWGRYDFDTPAGWEFYDLKKDPEEMQNEYHNPKYAKIVKNMKKDLKKKRKNLNEEDANFPHIQTVIKNHWND